MIGSNQTAPTATFPEVPEVSAIQEIPKSRRFTLIELDNFSIDLEYTDTFAILHLPRVEGMTKSKYIAGLEVFEEIKAFLFTLEFPALFVAFFPEDTLTHKLVKRLGFMPLGEHEGLAVYILKNEESPQWVQ